MKRRNWGLALKGLNHGNWFHGRSRVREKKEDGLTFCGNMCGRCVLFFVSKFHIHSSDPSGMYPQSPNLDLLICMLPCLTSWSDPGRRAFCSVRGVSRLRFWDVQWKLEVARGIFFECCRSLEAPGVRRYIVHLSCELCKCFRFCPSLGHCNAWLETMMVRFRKCL